MTTSVNFRCLTIKQGKGAPEMDQRTGRYAMTYWVHIHSDATNTNRRFRYHDSIHNYESGMRGLGPEELLFAFQSFVTDAQAGTLSFHDFCMDYGCDEDSRSDHATWQACKAATAKYNALWMATSIRDGREENMHDHIASVLDELASMGVE